jgi:predicted nucleotidyltransferase
MTDKENEVIETIFSKPEYKFHIRELGRITKIHPNTIIKITDKLAKNKIVLKRKHKNLVEVYCNHESESYKRKKQLFNISQIHDSGLLDYLIEFYNHPQTIILFGSYSRGEDWSTGDIDIAIVSNKKEKPSLTKFEKKLKRKIHLLAFNYKEISKEFYNNLINGFVLYGFIKSEKL